MTTNFSRARIAGHPIHPMLVAFPVTFYTSSFVGFLVYAATDDLFWWSAALWANLAGVVMAAVAALPGFIDWATGIPRNTAAKSTGLKHMLLNVSALVIFLINLFVQGSPWSFQAGAPTTTTALPEPMSAILLTGAGVLITVAAGALGWRLVQTHHVGIILEGEAAAERRRPVAPGVATSRPVTQP